MARPRKKHSAPDVGESAPVPESEVQSLHSVIAALQKRRELLEDAIFAIHTQLNRISIGLG